MKKVIRCAVVVMGVSLVILSAAASHTGEDLIYTIPLAVLGCLLCLTGAVQMRRIKTQKATIHTASTAYRLGYHHSMKCEGFNEEK